MNVLKSVKILKILKSVKILKILKSVKILNVLKFPKILNRLKNVYMCISYMCIFPYMDISLYDICYMYNVGQKRFTEKML